MEEKDQGFTLIELLVVIIIIGILAAIAIPVFLNQRKKGWDAAVESDLKNAATSMETYLTSNGNYSVQTPVGTDLTGVGFKYSAVSNYNAGAASIAVTAYDSTPAATSTTTAASAQGSYCFLATSASGQVWVYNSAKGGLQPTTVTTCPAANP